MSRKKIVIKISLIIILIFLIVCIKIFKFKIFNTKMDGIDRNAEKVDEKIYETEGLKFIEKEAFYNDDLGGRLTVEISNITNDTIIIDGIVVNFKNDKNEIIKTAKGIIYVEIEPNYSFEYTFDINENIFANPIKKEFIPNIIN